MAEMMLYDGSTTPPAHFWPTRSVVANRMAAYLRLQSGMFVPQQQTPLASSQTIGAKSSTTVSHSADASISMYMYSTGIIPTRVHAL